MRLLDTGSGQFVFVNKAEEVTYAILSHTWDPAGEQTYQDVCTIQQTWRSQLPVVSHSQDDHRANHNLADATPIVTRSQQSSEVRLSTPHRSRGFEWSHITPSTLGQDLRSGFRRAVHWIGHHRRRQPETPGKGMLPADKAPGSSAAAAVDIRSGDELPADGKSKELTFWDDPRLSAKVKNACATARAYGHRYIWIDSCCIDKTSSSELSEAINSMYAWYREAAVCYAFLADVPHEDDPNEPESWFRKSRWWRRGWTLQELIAPRVVVFLTADWDFLGTKSSLAELISDVSGIDYMILHHLKSARDVSVAERMSWASERETTRPEDEAYSLLGIFDINMPTLYGEGRGAFLRLQEEILKRIPDQTLLVWGVHSRFVTFPRSEETSQYALMLTLSDKSPGFFAESPSQFHKSHNIVPIPLPTLMSELNLDMGPLPTYAATPFGMPIPFPIMPANLCLPAGVCDRNPTFFLALLACEWEEHLLAIVCSLEQPSSNYKYMDRVGLHVQRPRDRANDVWIPHRYVAISRSLIKEHKDSIRIELLYGVSTEGSQKHRLLPGILPQVRLAPWTADVLQGLGWTRPVISEHSQETEGLVTHFTFSKGSTNLCINFQGVSGRRTFPDGSQLDTQSFVAIGVFNVLPERIDEYKEPSIRPSGRLSQKTVTLYLHRHPEVFTFKDLSGDVLSIRFTVTLFTELNFCHLEVEVLHHGKSLYPEIRGTPGLQVVTAPPQQNASNKRTAPLRRWDFPADDDERTRSAWRRAAAR